MESKAITSPFKFLDSYGKSDRDIFFGREAEVEELYERIFESRLIVLYGATGTGKTSLISCGLANQFDDRDWLPVFIQRGDHILRSLDHQLNAAAKTPLQAKANLPRRIRSVYLDFYKPVYLIFDQFEELFILGSEAEQIEFFESIHQVLDTELPCKILISIRGDYLDRLSKYEFILPDLLENRLYLERMSRRQLSEVIDQTAGAFNIVLVRKEEIVGRMVNNLYSAKGGLELINLQIYLDKLYRNDLERRGVESRPVHFDHELLDQTSQLEDVLTGFLKDQLLLVESELKERGPFPENLALAILFTLVTENGTKRQLDDRKVMEQLKRRKDIDPAVTAYCLQRFQELRIIRAID